MAGPKQLQALAELLPELRQGDVVDGRQIPLVLVSDPAATSYEDVAEAGGTDPRAVARRSVSGRWAIISQTCDLRADPVSAEPWLQIAPLRPAASDEEWERAIGGKGTTRQFAYSAQPWAEEKPLLDVRLVQTIEKLALVAPGITVYQGALAREIADQLGEWLGMRFGRYAFPKLLEDHVLRRLRTALDRQRGKPSADGALIRSLHGVWIEIQEKGWINILFALDPARAATEAALRPPQGTSQVDHLSTTAARLLSGIAKYLEDTSSPFSVASEVRTLDRVRASEILFRYAKLDF